jgi:hypothetical protein
MGKYLDIARKFEAARAEGAISAERPATVEHASSLSEPAPWPCEHCGRPAEIEAVEPRQSDGVLLTFWHCPPCQTWAVTPATLREPPVWASKRKQ